MNVLSTAELKNDQEGELFVKYICVCVCVHSVVSDSVTPMDCSPPGTSVQGISQARRLEWVANQGIKPTSLASCALAGGFFTSCAPAAAAAAAAATAESLQSCPTLCDPIDGSPPGSPVPGILQARTLEWAASSF